MKKLKDVCLSKMDATVEGSRSWDLAWAHGPIEEKHLHWSLSILGKEYYIKGTVAEFKRKAGEKIQ